MPSNRFIGLALVATGLAIGSLIPVFLVVYPAAGLSATADAATLLRVIARSPALFVGPGLVQLAGHAIGVVAVLGLWWRYGRESFVLTAATVGGIVWMSVDTIDNAISLQLVPALAAGQAGGDGSAVGTFAIVKSLTDALRLGGHFAGGLWILGASIALLRARRLHVAVAAFGIVAGAVFTGNPVVPALLNVSFMTVPAWLIVFGIVLARRDAAELASASAAMTYATPAR